LEPDLSSEKVDIIWYYADPNDTGVIQVKSSQNQINKAQAVKWARELESSIQAASYKLILIGPCAQSVVNLRKMGNVEIPHPKSLDVSGLIEQTAHRLDIYYENRNKPRVSAATREMLAKALITQLETYSTGSVPLSRDEFEQLLDRWLDAALEQVAKPSAKELLRLKEKTERLVKEVPHIRSLHLDHPEDKAWRTTARGYLGEFDRFLPGKGYVQQYDEIPWHLPNTPAEDTEDQRARYARACNNAEGLLRGALRELEEKLEEIQGRAS
jgi:hypothetical protein